MKEVQAMFVEKVTFIQTSTNRSINCPIIMYKNNSQDSRFLETNIKDINENSHY